MSKWTTSTSLMVIYNQFLLFLTFSPFPNKDDNGDEDNDEEDNKNNEEINKASSKIDEN